MVCRTVNIGGMTGIVCGPRGRRTTCSTPNCGRGTSALCDFPVVRKGKAGTCDAYLCDRCRVRKGEDKDFCPPHAKLPPLAPPVPGDPIPGDRRIHIETGLELYVVHVAEHEGTRHVTFSRNPPGRRGRCAGVLQTVPLDKWVAKTRAP